MMKKTTEKKPTEKSSLAHHAPYITIVAVVAVVAIVILILNFSKVQSFVKTSVSDEQLEQELSELSPEELDAVIADAEAGDSTAVAGQAFSAKYGISPSISAAPKVQVAKAAYKIKLGIIPLPVCLSLYNSSSNLGLAPPIPGDTVYASVSFFGGKIVQSSNEGDNPAIAQLRHQEMSIVIGQVNKTKYADYPYSPHTVLSTYVDYCFGNNQLVEYYCNPENPSGVSVKIYDCIADFGTPCTTFEYSGPGDYGSYNVGACKFDVE